MATIRKIVEVTAPADRVWEIFRDVGAVHTRLAPGFVVDTKLDGDARIVTFGNGVVARERIVAVNDELRRLAYAIVLKDGQHHSASFEITAVSDDRTRIVWTTDVLPDAAVATFGPMIEHGIEVMRATLNRC